MRRYAITICAVLSLALPCLSAAGALKASLDISVFKYDNARVYAEVYYSIPVSHLTFVATEDLFSAQVSARLLIKKDGDEWRDESWRLAKQVADSAAVDQNENMIDVLNYLMPPGDYVLTFTVTDMNNAENTLDIEKELHVDLFEADSIALSDIELATSIKRAEADSENVFMKNGLEVLPNPSTVFSATTPMLFYYMEAYNLDANISSDSYMTRFSVSDINGQPVNIVQPRTQKKNLLGSSVEVGAARISDLPSGSYNANLAIMDMDETIVSKRTKRFFVYNPEADTSSSYVAKRLSEAAIEASEFKDMTEKQLDEEFAMAQYIAEPDEINDFDTLEDVTAKRRYLYEFWMKRDPIPATVSNELRVAYMDKIEYANEQFKTFSRAGWKTDRGRVYLLYGPPSDIERFPNNPTSYNYQIWRYDQIEGGIMFVFADLQEFGEYMQLHSTKRGEPQNSRWEDVISKN